jgi:IclR family pca regulon transcriptional regulator
VPLRDMRGETVAALNVVVPAASPGPQMRIKELLPLLLEAAGELRALL